MPFKNSSVATSIHFLFRWPTHSKNRDGLLHSFSVNIIIYTSTVVVQEAQGQA